MSDPLADGRRFIVGWREWIGLPGLGIDAIKVKVDTGARTSSLHADDVRIEADAEGQRWARFRVHPVQRRSDVEVEARAPLVDERVVRSSNGVAERRPVIRADIDVGGHVWPVEITLTRRDVMGFRMLLGRTAIRGHAYVDPGASYATRPRPQRKRRTKKRVKKTKRVSG